MTGRDLIVYILQNNLENEPVFKDGTMLGFMTIEKTAEKMNVGVATVETWLSLGYLNYVQIGNLTLIPADSKSPMEVQR